MKIIDTHQHFWNYNPKTQEWINENMKVIRKNFLPEDIAPLLKENKVEGCVAVQADQSIAETNFLIQAAKNNTFIKGVVGWIDLKDKEIEQNLEFYKKENIVKGFRHIIQAEPTGFMQDLSFQKGLTALAKYNYSYDLLIYEHQLKEANILVKQLPSLPIVIDHIAKPNIKKGGRENWQKEIKAIAQNTNVYCKISGMVTEAHWESWSAEILKPYIDTVVEAFGTERIMFGSDWPVCLVACSYARWLECIQNYFNTFSTYEQEAFFANNAINFYKI